MPFLTGWRSRLTSGQLLQSHQPSVLDRSDSHVLVTGIQMGAYIASSAHAPALAPAVLQQRSAVKVGGCCKIATPHKLAEKRICKFSLVFCLGMITLTALRVCRSLVHVSHRGGRGKGAISSKFGRLADGSLNAEGGSRS